MGILTEFGVRTRDYRIRNDLLLFEMAQELEISCVDLSSYETGRKIPNQELVDKMSDLYGIDYTGCFD